MIDVYAELANEIKPKEGNRLGLRYGTIVAAPASDGTVTIRLPGSASSISGIRRLDNLNLSNGEHVWVLEQGTDLLVIGKLETASTPSQFTTLTVTDLTVEGIFRATKNSGTPAPVRLWNGIEIGHSASTPFIDFHRSSNPEEAADYDVRLINEATSRLRMYVAAGADWGEFRVGRAKIGAYPWSGSIAAFGNADVMDVDSTSYAVLHEADGSLDLNSKGTKKEIRLRIDGGDKIVIGTTGQRNYDWIRCMNSGTGIYFTPGGGGWYQNSGDAWLYAYANVPIYTADVIRANKALMRAWNGDWYHALFSHWDAGWSKGYMVRGDGYLWIMMGGTLTFRQYGSGEEYFWFNFWGDVRFNVPTVAPGDPDLRIAGSSQLLRNASQRKYKKSIKPLSLDNNPVFRMRPVRYHWKDDAREHGFRFNARYPDGYPGFIAEELYEDAHDAVDVDTLTGEPLSPATWPMLAYIVAGLQEINRRLTAIERKK